MARRVSGRGIAISWRTIVTSRRRQVRAVLSLFLDPPPTSIIGTIAIPIPPWSDGDEIERRIGLH